MINISQIRSQYPILESKVNGKPLVYFDNTATTQKPECVVKSLVDYYQNLNSNVHRGVHFLSREATEAFEIARKNVQNFIHAANSYEIIFTKGTTESINLAAQCLGKQYLKAGDEVLISAMEHHSNIVPWQMACKEHGAILKVIPLLPNGELDMQAFEKLLSQNTRIVAVAHTSNVLGTINPVKEIIQKAHQMGSIVLIDGAQAVAHSKIDVQDLDADFFVFSGHKMYAPMGVGVLYGKEKYLNEMPPYQYGGEMISEVRFEKTTFNELPFKFEAGTPNVADVLGLSEAINYIQSIGIENIASHEEMLLKYATQELEKIGDIEFYGTSQHKAGLISFNIKGQHPFDVGSILDHLGVAVRTGHHCAQPLMEILGISGTVRASFAVYNTKEEVDIFIAAVRQAKQMLS